MNSAPEGGFDERGHGATNEHFGDPRLAGGGGNPNSRLGLYQPGIDELEVERIFRGKTWNYVALEVEIPNPGDFKRSHVGPISVLVTRCKDGSIAVVENRCAHRGAEFCRVHRGNTPHLVCPYHQWTYDLNGTLIGVPFRRGSDKQGGMPSTFRTEDHGLRKLKVATRGGTIFVREHDAAGGLRVPCDREAIRPEHRRPSDLVDPRPLAQHRPASRDRRSLATARREAEAMSPDIFRIVIVIIFAAHGIGHVMGVMSPLGIDIQGASGESWAVSRFGSGLTNAIEAVLFLIPTIGFVIAAVGLWDRRRLVPRGGRRLGARLAHRHRPLPKPAADVLDARRRRRRRHPPGRHPRLPVAGHGDHRSPTL